MADIKQAAKWMQEGKHVRRPEIAGCLYGDWDDKDLFTGFIGQITEEGHEYPWGMSLRDLLADDWEIAE